jgi:hypothetical protein
MKTYKKIQYFLVLSMLLVFVTIPAFSVHGYCDSSRYNNCDYNYSNGQYYVSPLMTSTMPQSNYQNYYGNGYYPYNNYSYNNYSSNYNYLNHQYYNNLLSVSCWGGNNYGYQSQTINWKARVSGGRGGYYTYVWSGTDNPMSLNMGSINVQYLSSGLKSMSVTVTDSFGQTATTYCGSYFVNQNYYPVQYQGLYYR